MQKGPVARGVCRGTGDGRDRAGAVLAVGESGSAESKRKHLCCVAGNQGRF